MTAAEAVRYCQDVTQKRARNFWYGIRLLPTAKRQALSAVYAMARRIDDVGDGAMPDAEKRAALNEIEESLDRIDPRSTDPVLAALGMTTERFPLPLGAFRELVRGVRMDVEGTEYRSFDELVVYCRRVAGTIGRLSVAVFGAGRRAEAERLADDLGVAMQLTNILRDVREDLERGRVYFPAEDLERFDCTAANLNGAANDASMALVRFEVERARRWFDRGLGLFPLLDRRSAACAGAMAGIYLRLLDRIERSPTEILGRRISLSRWEKAWVTGRALAGVVA
ncbi:MAG: presqualene diphosphate synthase HpnD [Actinomycetota bacterium]|nr:presqualene diphosphate synthase HpnD [Actinomycetota bacterium]